MLQRSGFAARQHPAVVGHVRIAGERLLTGDDEMVAVLDRAHFHAGQIGSGLRLAVADKPRQLAAADPRQEFGLLGLRAQRHDRVRHVGDRAVQTGSAVILHLVPEDGLIDPASSAAAIFLGPTHADVAGRAELASECPGEIDRPHALLGRVAMSLPNLRRQFALEKRPHLVAKRRLVRRQFQIHRFSRSLKTGRQRFRDGRIPPRRYRAIR